jgi:hypothetical protein
VRVALLTLLALAPLAAGAAPLSVPLAVRETAGVARRGEAATAAVPLPRGRVRDAAALWLARPDGGAALAQTAVLERWPDGSLRWLLLDFVADVAARGQATYVLRDGKRPKPPAGARLRTETRAATLRVDTGVLRVDVSADPPGIAQVEAGSARVGPITLPRLRLATGADEAPGAARLERETEGPVRTEILVTGRWAAGLDYEARLAAFAGSPLLRLRLTVVHRADADYLALRALPLEIPGRLVRAATSVDGKVTAFAPLDAPHTVRHDDARPALVDGAAAGRHADGWAEATTADGTALTIVRTPFWEEYPQAIALAPDRLAMDLAAGGEAPVRLGRGAAKTFEVWLAATAKGRSLAARDALARTTAPLTALPPARWIVESRALPHALASDAPGARDFLARLTVAYGRYRAGADRERWDDGPPVDCAARTAEHPRVGFYGVLNWGDWNFPGYRDHAEGCDGWGNLEYDLTESLGVGWAATGSDVFRDGFLAAARHFRDVDVIHHAPAHPDRVGLNHPHKPLHFAPESRKTVDLGHTWAEGLVTHWRLTGERRSLAAARALADAVSRRLGKARNPRQFGWPMIALAAVHQATGETRYLDAARAFAEAAAARWQPTPAAGDWKMGILADGLAAVHEAGGGDALRRWLVAYADAYLAEAGRFADARFALPLGYVAALTGEPRYEAAALSAVRAMRIGEWGKTLGSSARVGFRVLGPLAVGQVRTGPSPEIRIPPARPARRPRAQPAPRLPRGRPSPADREAGTRKKPEKNR